MLLALGPLTNVALSYGPSPRWREVSAHLFMGGAIGAGNATPVAEFNAWQDPEAVSVVVHSPIPVTMYGLDVFSRPGWTRRRSAAGRRPRSRRPAGGGLLGAHARTEADGGEPGPPPWATPGRPAS